MRLEIRSASHFLSDLLRLGHSLTDQQLELFRGTLEDLLRKHYQHHWFPEHPAKGSGYRCIRINHKMDPLLSRAAQACGVNDSSLLRNMFPNELTLWIDPREVSYRIGENGSICVLYDGDAVPTNCNSGGSGNTTSHHGHPYHQNHHPYHSHDGLGSSNSSTSATSASSVMLDRYSTCKESVRGFDHLIMDNRNLNLVEQFTQYVSS